jgi:hypothetical protein
MSRRARILKVAGISLALWLAVQVPQAAAASYTWGASTTASAAVDGSGTGIRNDRVEYL